MSRTWGNYLFAPLQTCLVISGEGTDNIMTGTEIALLWNVAYSVPASTIWRLAKRNRIILFSLVRVVSICWQDWCPCLALWRQRVSSEPCSSPKWKMCVLTRHGEQVPCRVLQMALYSAPALAFRPLPLMNQFSHFMNTSFSVTTSRSLLIASYWRLLKQHAFTTVVTGQISIATGNGVNRYKQIILNLAHIYTGILFIFIFGKTEKTKMKLRISKNLIIINSDKPWAKNKLGRTPSKSHQKWTTKTWNPSFIQMPVVTRSYCNEFIM